MKYILFILLLVCTWGGLQAQDRVIAVDVAQSKGQLNRSYQMCVGAGRANEGLRADWQRQLRVVKQECGFKYIRLPRG